VDPAEPSGSKRCYVMATSKRMGGVDNLLTADDLVNLPRANRFVSMKPELAIPSALLIAASAALLASPLRRLFRMLRTLWSS
jgi:hypothetical protein